jgi:hypothetical protein
MVVFVRLVQKPVPRVKPPASRLPLGETGSHNDDWSDR